MAPHKRTKRKKSDGESYQDELRTADKRIAVAGKNGARGGAATLARYGPKYFKKLAAKRKRFGAGPGRPSTK